MKIKRQQHIIQGQVQGVGFRPFIYRLALKHALTGFVTNTPLGVVIEVEGNNESLEAFTRDIPLCLPALAKIFSHTVEDIGEKELSATKEKETEFTIKHSEIGNHEGHHVLISPDVALCDNCRQDMLSKENHRYAYPFTNCTDCGPRYTIIKSIPYDRPYTSMACFPLCETCQKEFDNPLDRRFHAQPNACPSCGPSLYLYAKNKVTEKFECLSQDKEALDQLTQALKRGKIVAIKSLGGFQFACDAYNENAVNLLRKRKNRPNKAFALMVKDLETAHNLAYIGKNAEELLTSPAAPIVLCPSKENTLPKNIAPDTNRIGLMLPYTPLHQVLFNELRPKDSFNQKNLEVNKVPSTFIDALIMTSANHKGNPICIGNRQAMDELDELADFYLCHNRDILIRVDDSVCLALEENSYMQYSFSEQGSEQGQVNKEFTKGCSVFDDDFVQALEKNNSLPKALYFRRARGYVPSPINMPPTENICPSVLATGAHLKNTFCLTREQQAFVSQHIGEPDNISIMDFFEHTLNHMQKVLEVHPQKIICDKHPDFPTSHFAHEFAQRNEIKLETLPHHFAHIYAVLAEQENYTLEPVLGIILDGTGFGLDNTIWGGEILYLDPKTKTMLRLARLTPIPLVGGEAAIYEPWRIAQALFEKSIEKGYLDASFKDSFSFPWVQDESIVPISKILSNLIQKEQYITYSSGCGRLFDAISALCGLCTKSEYEGQAAIRLEKVLLDTVLDTAKKTDRVSPKNSLTNRVEKIHSPSFIRIADNFTEILAKKQERIAGKDFPNEKQDSEVLLEIDSYALFAEAVKMLAQNTSVGEVSHFFHKSLVIALKDSMNILKQYLTIDAVALGGGVMNNEYVIRYLSASLQEEYTLYLPNTIPSGDGGISLGQAYYGSLFS